MIIDKAKLQPLLWVVVGAWNAGDQDLQVHTDALDEFLGEQTVEEVALQLLAELALSKEAQELYRADKIRLAHEVDRLRGESEALRDDLEQAQYDADAWTNQEESVWVQVFLGEGDDPFISAVQGAVCIEQLSLIQAKILAGAEDLLESGPGYYVLECRHCQAHYDNVGMTEPAHWEIDLESYRRFPWLDEAEAKEASHG